MAWLEAHQDLRDHPKTKRAARALGISRPQMIGHLLCLWWWCLDYAEDGNLTDFDNADIADAAEWEGEPDDFVHALLHCGPADRAGFLTNGDGLRINDWSQYGGKYVTKRNQGRDRQRTYRERNAEVTRYTDVSNTPREDKSKEDESTGDNAADDDFRGKLIGQWEAVLGMFPTASYPEAIGYMDRLKKGNVLDWWQLAITETVDKAKRPSWQYMKSILESWLAAGHPSTAGKNGTDPAKSKPATGMHRQASPDGSEWIYTDIATGKVARREPRETEELF